MYLQSLDELKKYINDLSIMTEEELMILTAEKSSIYVEEISS